MSLIRQVSLLIAVTLVLAFAGSVAVNVAFTRDVLQTELRAKNSDNATALALALSQQRGDIGLIRMIATAQFNTGFYRHIRLATDDGTVLLDRRAEPAERAAPGWFVALVPLASVPGRAQVSDGWRSVGTVEVESQVSYAQDALWQGSLAAMAALALVGAAAGGCGALFVARLRRPIEQTVQQARAIERGDYQPAGEPAVPEFRRVTRAMNAMAARLKRVLEAQAAQVESLRRDAHHDALTGLANRAHFTGRLTALLDAEDGAAACGLVMLRVQQLGELNRQLGRAAVDRALGAIGQTLATYAAHVPGCFVGRLNGSDFALALPVGDLALETAHAVTDLLRAALPAFGPGVAVVVGAGESRQGAASGRLTALMAAADLALARAESRGGFCVDAEAAAPGDGPGRGETAWHDNMRQAVAEGRMRLASYPVVDAMRRIVHLECPLRLRLDADGDEVAAAVWLPLALRTRLTAAVDERAIDLALAESARDGQPRAVNIAAASLADTGFAPRVAALLLGAPRAAARLWLELPERAAVEHFDRVQSFGRQVRPAGARLGLEHAGEHIAGITRLHELGLDYVKLDASAVVGVADDAGRAGFVASLSNLLHGLALQVVAEGVADAADADALWRCGVDGITGPWASTVVAEF